MANLTATQLLIDAIFRVGKVVSIVGRDVKVRVDKTKNTSHLLYDGKLIRNVSVGGYVKLLKGFTRIVGKVDGEYVAVDKRHPAGLYGSDKDRIDRILDIKLLGFFDGAVFKRGIKELPLIDNECHLLDSSEFNQVHNFIRSGDEPLTIGVLALEKGLSLSVGVNALFASHIGIFGNTGSGKSYTLAKLYRGLFEQYGSSDKFKRNTHFFLLDFNGEYVGADCIVDSKLKSTFVLSTADPHDKFPIAKAAIESGTFWSIFLTATEKTQAPFIKRALGSTYYSKRMDTEARFKELLKEFLLSLVSHSNKLLDQGLHINFLKELRAALGDCVDNLGTLIDDYQANLKWHSKNSKFYYVFGGGKTHYSDESAFFDTVISDKVDTLQIRIDALTHLDKVRLRFILKFYDEIVRGFSSSEHIAPLIKRLEKRIGDLDKVIEVSDDKRVAYGEKNFTIVSLKEVSISMKKVLPLLLCKQIYEEKKKACNRERYLNIVIDEAHNILSYASERESETWKDYRLETFEEIIKEGRKFGVFVTVASQRPFDISTTIISQLHNFFLHRLINNKDIEAVEKSISYLDRVSFGLLPILPTGTCILAGQLAQIPVVVEIGRIPEAHEPDNKTMTLVDKWKDESPAPGV